MNSYQSKIGDYKISCYPLPSTMEGLINLPTVSSAKSRMGRPATKKLVIESHSHIKMEAVFSMNLLDGKYYNGKATIESVLKHFKKTFKRNLKISIS